MILFDFATPAEQARVKVMLRPEDSPLFSPTRHGPAFSPKFDADEPIRRQRFARGIPQGDDGADSDVDLLERDGAEEQASAQDEQASQDSQEQGGIGAQDGMASDGLAAEGAAVEEGDDAARAAAASISEPSAEPAAEPSADAHSDNNALASGADAEAPAAAEVGAVAADSGLADGAVTDAASADVQGVPDSGAATQEAATEASTEHALEDTDANPDSVDALASSESAGAAEQNDAEGSDASNASADASTEDLVKQAFEAGYAAAKAELGEGAAAPNAEAEDAAYLRGLEEGQRQTKDELEAEVLLAADDLKALANQLAQAARDTETFYQPLLKLSMHLAEQLVRGELSLSGQAVTRLVERCLSEFQQETSAPIVVRMNPADHERHLAYGAMAPKNMDLRPDPSLSAGSVKVSMNGAMIEDLIEHRRQALWDALMSAAATPDDDLPDSFLRNVAIVKEAMASVDDESTQPPAL
jgi:hypothetical protein